MHHLKPAPRAGDLGAGSRRPVAPGLTVQQTYGYLYVGMQVSRARSFPVRSSTTLFRALGDPTRFRIVALLAHGELCVCHIEKALGVSQPNASRQLGILRAAGVVESRRDGSWVHYRLAEQDDALRKRQLAALVRGFAEDTALRKEIASIVRSCGPAACK